MWRGQTRFVVSPLLKRHVNEINGRGPNFAAERASVGRRERRLLVVIKETE
jgi:hypothetical protein